MSSFGCREYRLLGERGRERGREREREGEREGERDPGVNSDTLQYY